MADYKQRVPKLIGESADQHLHVYYSAVVYDRLRSFSVKSEKIWFRRSSPEFRVHLFVLPIVFDTWSPGGGGGGYSPKIPIRVCAAQRGRDFGTPYLERGIHFRDVS